MITPDFSLISELQRLGYKKIIGLDEVGRGAIAGPIVVAAVEIYTNINGVTDSKLLTRNKREKLAQQIKDHATNITIGQASNTEIDKFGIVTAQEIAYERALNDTCADLYLTDYYPLKNYAYLSLPKGDQIFYPVAAASIVAKVYRDNLMQKYSEQYPNYLWQNNAGYGTKKHFNAIDKFGLTQLHRTTYLGSAD